MSEKSPFRRDFSRGTSVQPDMARPASTYQPPQQPVIPQTEVKEKPVKKSNKRTFRKVMLWVGVGLIIVVFAGVAAYFAISTKNLKQENQKLSSPQETAQKQQDKTVEAVGKLVVLPEGESPTLATVTDTTKLQGQAFFADAKQGDIAIIYPKAKKAYLYRPSENKMVNIAPLTLNDSSAKSSQ